MAKQPEVTAHADPNVMVSPMSAFIRMHLFAEIRALAVFVIVQLILASFDFGMWFHVLLSLVCTILWILFDFNDTLNAAMRDRNLVKYSFIEYDKWKGLKSGLYAQIPGLVVIIMIWATNHSAGGLNDWVRLFYFILYGPVTVLTARLESISTVLLIFPIWICPAVSVLAYYLGYHEVSFLTKLVYKNRARNKKLR